MKPFFQSPERQKALDEAARRWEGTPYFANSASRGHGVGCVELNHELWIEMGAIPRLELPRYKVDHGHHATEGQLLQFLTTHEALKHRLVFVPILGNLLPGDILGCRSGHVDHHLAQVIRWEKVIHSVESHGVIIHDHTEGKFANRVLYALRLLEEGRA